MAAVAETNVGKVETMMEYAQEACPLAYMVRIRNA